MIGKDGVPMLYFFDSCKASIRTIPRLQHDPMKAEDIGTQSVDHAADETRSACMAGHLPVTVWPGLRDG